MRISGPAGVLLAAARFGDRRPRPSAIVLLHQIGGAGLCGWGDFAWQATQRGVPAVAVDMCGYGESTCPRRLFTDARTQVDLAVRYARTSLGADRVTVVGASMGGSQTVRAMAAGARADAWVDISGPSWWDDTVLLDVADRIDAPGLVIQTRTDGTLEYDNARRLAHQSGASFVDGGSGHGWELTTTPRGTLTDVGALVLRFSRG